MSAAALILLLAAAPRPEAEAEKLLKQGVELRRQGQDEQALTLFQEALARHPTPRARAQIALAEQALARWVEAERDLLSALGERADPWIRSHRSTLEQALAAIRARLGELEIRSPTPGARLVLPGAAPVDLPLPAPLRVVAGALEVRVEAPEHEPWSRRVDIPGGGRVEEVAALRPKAPPPPAAPAPPPTELLRPRPEPPTRLTPYAWATGGAALAGAGAGALFLYLREQSAARYNDDALCLPPNGLTRDENCGDERQAAERDGAIALGAFIAAGVLGAAAATLFALDPGEEAPTLACGPVEGSGALCTLRW